MLFRNIINAIVKRGLNAYALANALECSTLKIKRSLNTLFKNYSLSVFVALESENLGLGKVALICRDSKLKIETEKNLFIPLLNLFRADFEENKFISVIYYTDKESLEAISNAVNFLQKRKLVNCELRKVLGTKKFYRKVECYDFLRKSWICEDKDEIKSKCSTMTPDEKDIKLITMLQVNPSIPYYLHPHYRHVKKIISGFFYTLGEKDFVIDIVSKEDVSDLDANIIWIARIEDKFISELHVSHSELQKVIEKLRDYGEIFLAPKTPQYAIGYSIPFEIFREKKWAFPKILTQ